MTDKNSATSPNPDENSGHRHLERVVDELRTVLSDLGRPKRTEKSNENFVEKKEPARPPVDRVHTEPEPPVYSPPIAEPLTTSPVSSDADFWSGNVLGWPQNGDTHIPEPTPTQEPPAPAPLNGHDDEPTDEELIRSLGIRNEALIMRDPVDAINMEEADSVLSDARTELGPSPFGPAGHELGSEWGAEEPIVSEPELPEAPKSPLDIFPPKERASETPLSANPFSPTFDAFQEEKSVELPPSPAIEPSAVPIPQTIHKKPELPKTNVPNLSLDEPQMKPKGHVQVACIFPEGQEKSGQAFLSKLRELGEKSKKTLNIQAVFVHPWSSDKIDIAAWKKSAVLSGADIMFVIVSKANASSLKTLNGSDPMNEIKSRIIYLEQIPLRTLYADIIVDLQRGG